LPNIYEPGLNRDVWDGRMFEMVTCDALNYNFSHPCPDMVQGMSRTSPTFHWRDREKPGEVWEKSWISLPGGLDRNEWDWRDVWDILGRDIIVAEW